MKTLLIVLISLISTNINAQVDKTKEEWIATAQKEAEKVFSKYHAICNGRVIVQSRYAHYHEFSGSKAEVSVIGLYYISEADRLNGKLWSGKIVVKMGDSSRSMRTTEDGTRKLSAWGFGRAAEFDFVFSDGRWQVVKDKIDSPDWTLEPDVSCSVITEPRKYTR